MSRWCWISVVTILGLAGGCVANEPDPTATQQEPLALGEPELGVSQSCVVNDHCPLGTGCRDGTCINIVDFSPPPEDPWNFPCVSDGQCAPLGGRCEVDLATYERGDVPGHCTAPSCSASWSQLVVPPNGTSDFIVTSEGMPWGSYSLMYGTKNGVTDVNGSYYNWVSGVFPITNFPGFAGTYMRYLDMYAPDGRWFCTTNEAYSIAQ